MKRKKSLIFSALLFVMPVIALAAGFVPCGGPGEPVCQICYWVDQVNLVVRWLVSIFSVVFSITLIIAGYKLVTSAGNVSAKSDAKSMITNSFIGFVIVLSGWLLIDFVMQSLVNQEKYGGPWNQIECVEQPVSVIAVYNKQDVEDNYGTVNEDDVNDAILSDRADCDPAVLKGMGMSDTQANVFSCIAQAESSCNNNAQNNTSSARGIFQITRGWNDTCHNLNLPACKSAAQGAGFSNDGNLNCSKAFGSGGRIKAGMEQLANYCNAAASNQSCNTAAALCLYNNGGYGHWLGTKSAPHTKQQACVAKYAN